MPLSGEKLLDQRNTISLSEAPAVTDYQSPNLSISTRYLQAGWGGERVRPYIWVAKPKGWGEILNFEQ